MFFFFSFGTPLELGGQYKVGEIADVVARADSQDDRKTVLRRLRYWTNLQLLKPNAHLHMGEGRHRRYDKSQIYVAALLNALSKYHLTIDMLTNASNFFQNEIRTNPHILEHDREGGDELLFCIYEKTDGSGSFAIISTEGDRQLTKIRSALYINLTILYHHLGT